MQLLANIATTLTNVMPTVMLSAMPTTGMELKLRRVEAMVKQRDIAARMGRSRAAVHRYEGLRVVPATVAAQYIEALGTLADIASDPDGLVASGHGEAA